MSLILNIADTHYTVSDRHKLNNLKFNCHQAVVDEWGKRVERIHHYGDGSDRPGINPELQTREAEIWSSLGKDIEKVFYCAGNHELYLGRYAPISAFQQGTRTVGKGMHVVGRDALIEAPFCYRGFDLVPIPDRMEGAKFFCGHQPINYGKQKFFGPETPTAQELNQLGWDQMFMGDIHQAADIGKVHSIGQLFPTSFNDRDIEGSYMIFDTETQKVKRIKVEGYPVFRIFEIEEWFDGADRSTNEYLVKGNIVRINLRGSAKFIADKQAGIEKYFRDMNPRTLEVYPFVTAQAKVQVAVQYETALEAVQREAQDEKWMDGELILAEEIMKGYSK